MRVKRAPLCLRLWFGKLSRLTWGTTGMGCYRLLPASCLEDVLVDFDPDVMGSARRGFPRLEARALVENLSVEVRTQKFTSSFPSELGFVFPRDFYSMWETQCISVPFPTPCSAGLSSFGGTQLIGVGGLTKQWGAWCRQLPALACSSRCGFFSPSLLESATS